MRAVVLSFIAAATISLASALPWPQGFKYPSSYVNKYTQLRRNASPANTFTPDLSTVEYNYVDGVNKKEAYFYETKKA